MPVTTRLSHFIKAAGLGLVASAGFLPAAAASDLVVEEDAIISLAGSPYVNEVAGEVDAAGRPSLSLTVTFISPCVMEAGVEPVLYASAEDGPFVLVLRQKASEAGCPDIARPVDGKIRILLPANVNGQGIYLVAKPWRGNAEGRSDQPIMFKSSGTGGHDIVLEANRDPEARLPRMEVSGVGADADGGYRITAKMALGGCAAEDVGLNLFELPDRDGTPVADVLLATLPAACQPEDAASDLTLSIRAPARGFARIVMVLNEAVPQPRAIP
ncbi:hypothetical protein SAMN05877838_3179 [Hoeflea halophila]|uniref:Uncharacterized protein n=1 Tax=Hoeflea halophila TaxID=714899 RepID=A0A286IDR1_9HYPH|nr:hypothetical protein [Hoeflea halophila]SOE18258.1 hypothetical protein SAMN05877838_3179 [Hoeflea halophila]